MNKILNLQNFLSLIKDTGSAPLTFYKLAFLSCILEKELSTREISDLMGVTQAAASRSMEDLRLLGLAEHTSEEYAAPYKLTPQGESLLWDLEGAMEGSVSYDPPTVKRKVQYTKAINARTVPLRSVPDIVTHKVHGPTPRTRSWL